MNVQEVQDWAYLIVPNVAFAAILAYIGIGMWVNHRDRKNTND